VLEVKTPIVMQDACDKLISRVRYESAVLTLRPKEDYNIQCRSHDADTQAIRDATKLYVETWIVPMLEAIKRGDLATLRTQTRN
jgi:hypothetical protein